MNGVRAFPGFKNLKQNEVTVSKPHLERRRLRKLGVGALTPPAVIHFIYCQSCVLG